MYYSSGTYEAFAHPEKPKDVDKKSAYIIGTGLAGLAAAFYLVRDRLCQLLRSTYEEWRDNPPLVISTHYSKSVKLPVFQINLEKYGIN